jgi:DNA-binding transcriptional regulator LsrR (DeoR family)
MNDKAKLLIKIAKLYYEDNLTQDTIAHKLRMSRPRVSRLMQEAIDTGIVKITISPEPSGFTSFENQLESKFDLLEAVVVDVSDPDSPDQVARDMGAAAAEYFSRLVQDGDNVGFTWGLSLAAMVENIKPEKKSNVTILQMVGGLGEPGSDSHATGLVSRAAMALTGTVCLMPSPGVVSSMEAANLLRSDRYISKTLQKVKDIDIAFVGIGSPTKGSLLMRDETIISWKELDPMIKAGAVGDIGLHFFDVHGNAILSELNNRVIGISLEDIKKINRVVGLAGGTDKFEAILGAIRGRYINTIITDKYTARRLIDVTE